MQEETDLKNARPPLGFLYENLVRSSIEIYIEAPAAAVAMICYLSIAIVACMCYIDFLPPTLFGVFCLWFFLCRKLRCLIDDSCRKHLAAMARAIFGAYRGFGVTGLMEIKTDRYGIWYRYGYKYRSKYRYRYRYGNRFRYIYIDTNIDVDNKIWQPTRTEGWEKCFFRGSREMTLKKLVCHYIGVS